MNKGVGVIRKLATPLVFVLGCGSFSSGCSENASWLEFSDSLNTELVSLEDDSLSENSIAESQQIPFVPPYPDRENPFMYVGENVSQGDSTFSGSLSTIVVQGFASANGQAVILNIAGNVRTLKVGEAISGIEIIQITPPSVTLKAGGREWTASMFDHGK